MTLSFMRGVVPAFFLCGILLLSPALAQEAAPARAISMVTGAPTGTYYRFGNDMKDVIAVDNVTISVKESKGSIDNISRITSNENASLGIVQSDVLGFLMRSEEPQSKKLAENLRMIFPFYQEEIHIVAGAHIQQFSHLNGKTVAVGPSGSGSWLTAMNLFNLTGVRPVKLLRLSAEEGMVEVLRGRADAMIYVAGKPVQLFQNLEALIAKDGDNAALTEIHLLPLDDTALLAEYAPAEITPADYSFVAKKTPTLAVTAVLIAYDFSNGDNDYAQRRCDDIRHFSRALAKRIGQLKTSGHPKWKEVNLNADVGIWKKDVCSVSDPQSRTIEDELLNTIDMKW